MQKKKKEEDKKYQETLTYICDSSYRKKSKLKPEITKINPDHYSDSEKKVLKKQEFNIVDKPKNYKEPEPVYIKNKESFFEKIRTRFKFLFKD